MTADVIAARAYDTLKSIGTSASLQLNDDDLRR